MQQQFQDSTKSLSYEEQNKSIVNPRIVEPYLNILKDLQTLRSQDNSLAGKITINKIAIVGMQSAGKSTLLEWLIGFPGILRKQNGIGSKCVTLFTVDTHNKGKIRVYLSKNGFNSETDEFQESDSKGIIERYNQLLEDIEEEISEDEIVIYIGGGNLPLVIKDIPGYTVETDYSKQVTRKIFQNQLLSDDTIVIYATDISKEMMVHEEIAKELPMKKIILAFTKIDINFTQHGEKILNLINPPEESKKPLGFIGLIPPIPDYMKLNLSKEEKLKKKEEYEKNILEMSPEEHKRQMVLHQQEEKEIFDSIQIIRDNRQLFGKQAALKTLNKILFQSLHESLPTQISILDQEIDSVQITLDDLQQYFKHDETKQQILSIDSVEGQRSKLKDIFLQLDINYSLYKKNYQNLLSKIQQWFESINHTSIIFLNYSIIYKFILDTRSDLNLEDNSQIATVLISDFTNLYHLLIPKIISSLKENIHNDIHDTIKNWGANNNLQIIQITEKILAYIDENIITQLKQTLLNNFEAYSIPCQYQTFNDKISSVKIQSSQLEMKNSLYQQYFQKYYNNDNNKELMDKFKISIGQDISSFLNQANQYLANLTHSNKSLLIKLFKEMNDTLFGGLDILNPMFKKYQEYLKQIDQMNKIYVNFERDFQRYSEQVNNISLYKFFYFETHQNDLYMMCYKFINQLTQRIFKNEFRLTINNILNDLTIEEIKYLLESDATLTKKKNQNEESLKSLKKLHQNCQRLLEILESETN